MNTTVEIRGRLVGEESISVSSTAIGFTQATCIPEGLPAADMAVVTVETDAVRYRSSGVSPSTGHKLAADASLIVYGTNYLRTIKFIRVTNDATLRVSYYRQGD